MHSLKNLQGEVGREQTSTDTNSYKGIPMFCDEGLHETCFAKIEHLPKNTSVLVLGSGSGAFDQRLVDAGFTSVTSVDFRPDFFRAKGATLIERDLNEDFAELGTFDLIIAIELIEHLENPAHFLRNIAKCISDTGKVIITTPNIESGPSRAGFLTLGRLAFFTEEDMKGSGHISPLLHHVFIFHAKNANLSVISHSYNRNAWKARFRSNIRECIHHLTKLSLVRTGIVFAKTILLVLLWPITSLNNKDGNIHIYELGKTN